MSRRLILAVPLLLAACGREPEPPPPPPPPSPVPAAEAAPLPVDRGDGLRVEIAKEGYGPRSKIGDEVSFVYTARTRTSDEVVSSNEGSPVPMRMRLGEKGMLPGLTRALEGLRAGTKARIEIPPALAYGKDGIPGSNVPPEETLVFDVEVLDVR